VSAARWVAQSGELGGPRPLDGPGAGARRAGPSGWASERERRALGRGRLSRRGCGAGQARLLGCTARWDAGVGHALLAWSAGLQWGSVKEGGGSWAGTGQESRRVGHAKGRLGG
jgi:hypothetical protein